MSNVDIEAWIKKRVAHMITRGAMYGPPIAVETQFLLLMEVRLALTVSASELNAAQAGLRRLWQLATHELGKEGQGADEEEDHALVAQAMRKVCAKLGLVLPSLG